MRITFPRDRPKSTADVRQPTDRTIHDGHKAGAAAALRPARREPCGSSTRCRPEHDAQAAPAGKRLVRCTVRSVPEHPKEGEGLGGEMPKKDLEATQTASGPGLPPSIHAPSRLFKDSLLARPGMAGTTQQAHKRLVVVRRYGPEPDRRLEKLPGMEFFNKLLGRGVAGATSSEDRRRVVRALGCPAKPKGRETRGRSTADFHQPARHRRAARAVDPGAAQGARLPTLRKV